MSRLNVEKLAGNTRERYPQRGERYDAELKLRYARMQEANVEAIEEEMPRFGIAYCGDCDEGHGSSNPHPYYGCGTCRAGQGFLLAEDSDALWALAWSPDYVGHFDYITDRPVEG